jgi:hypothetical protein
MRIEILKRKHKSIISNLISIISNLRLPEFYCKFRVQQVFKFHLNVGFTSKNLANPFFLIESLTIF